jgi:hypothetical protein
LSLDFNRIDRQNVAMNSWNRKLTVPRIEANRPIRVVSAFENGGVRDLDEGEVLEFAFDVPYKYLGEREGRAVVVVDADVPPGRD